MDNEELYPELREYIFQYCGKYFRNEQRLARLHLKESMNYYQNVNFVMFRILTHGGKIINNKDVSELTNDGYEAYKQKISERIFREHKNQLELNLCPVCDKIARTPLAKQCQFCFYDWHQ